MSRIWIAALILAGVPQAVPAQNPALDTARRAGAIGERFDGYMGFAAEPGAAVRAQVSAINIRRRALYTSLASSRRVTPSEVGITAGCELLARVGVGQAYMLADGAWRRRGAGDPAPVPDYCR